MSVKLTLNEFLDNNNITRYLLSQRSGISYQVVDKYYKNTVVRYDSYVLNQFCSALDCDISDLIKFEKD